MTDHPAISALAIEPTTTQHDTPNVRPVFRTLMASLDSYQDAVQGMIEPVRLLTPTSPQYEATLYVNEEFLLGQFDDWPRRGYNSIATDLCGFTGRPDLLMQGILGPTVLVGPTDPEGYDTDVPEEFVLLVNIIAEEAGVASHELPVASRNNLQN